MLIASIVIFALIAGIMVMLAQVRHGFIDLVHFESPRPRK